MQQRRGDLFKNCSFDLVKMNILQVCKNKNSILLKKFYANLKHFATLESASGHDLGIFLANRDV